MTTAQYIELFANAEKWGNQYLFTPPKYRQRARFSFVTSSKFINDQSIGLLKGTAMSNDALRLAMMNRAGYTCLQSSNYVVRYLPRVLNTVGILTVGYMNHKGRSWYYFDKNRVLTWVKRPGSIVTENGINLHVWITLQSGEIVDLVGAAGIATELYKSEEDYEKGVDMVKNPFIGTVESLSQARRVKYFPLGVGRHFLLKIGLPKHAFQLNSVLFNA